VLFAASLGLIAVASTGLWASTGFSLLLRWRFEILTLPIRRANSYLLVLGQQAPFQTLAPT
jgi:hypothetical protein